MKMEETNFIEQINSYSKLSKDWNGYSAEIPTDVTIATAVDVVRQLMQYNITPYFIAPDPNGGIMIELENGTKSMEIEVIGETLINHYN